MTPSVKATNPSLREVLEDLMLVLTQKEKEVVIRRFGLGAEPRQTLEKIGQEFSVTRERIRQIEKIALSKLRRTIDTTYLAQIHKLARETLENRGGLCDEETLIAEVIKKLSSSEQVDQYIAVLALAVHPDFEATERNLQFHRFWRLAAMSEEDAKNVCQAIYGVLSKKKDVVSYEALASEVQNYLMEKNKNVPKETVLSAMEVDKRFKKTKDGLGLIHWRHINPKSIRDKSYIILKQSGKPLHFVEVANRILQAGFDKKMVTVQAVHNELIRNDLFVLVGRGLYALKEWGYKRGTVSDIIEDLLGKKSPMSKKEIIEGVLKQRTVKKGTISLNLQKNPQFERVGRAMYSLTEK